MYVRRRAARIALALILLGALALRISAVTFGLPSLYDPDEPMFMLVALKVLTSGSLNPGWFGHPGSTTIYLVAVIDALVAGVSLLSGRFADLAGLTRAAYAGPSILFIPARLGMVLLGVAAVWLTYAVAKRLFGTRAGLIAAGLLAINSLHVAWSAIVRTDIHASVFMLACLLFAIRAAEHGQMRDYLLAGLFAGFATATKWPAASVFVSILGAAGCRMFARSGSVAREARLVVVAGVAFLVGIFIASPFIFLAWQTVLSNVSGELKPSHLAHTGHGFIGNLAWYLADPVGASMGFIGLVFAMVGFVVAARHPIARWTILPAAIAFLLLISGQKMIWSRWVLPVLPMLAAFAAAAIVELSRKLGELIGARQRPIALAVIVAIVVAPAMATTYGQINERRNDTRIQAARWASAHIPPGSTVVLEHLELSLRDQPWRIIFPLGNAGCVDARQLLRQKVGFGRVEQLRAGSPIVDLGNVSSSTLSTCRANYAILTYYDLYRAEADTFPKQIARYHAILSGGRTVALFRPDPGHAGGPIVRVVALQQH